MEIKIKELSKTHRAVIAAHYMREQYFIHETMLPACEAVLEKFPELTADQVICMWLATNASNCSMAECEEIELPSIGGDNE
ncbi:hypothetical protein [Vibrio sp. STUT-A11]|uniref:hypothetical protein n=1 Tax=Vibrio sp. STUT-A11 TaxID=2976236 RepID=UPI0022329BD1|nr:hypothetical protein [Vibrio sp. STUT-A11]BDR12900.1 hypothetical protein VspSTUT11_08760 [Vibrio sp. STUT-A11]